ncbi:MAG: heme exporter protein CcmD [Alphaproteobacteria bacterium]
MESLLDFLAMGGYGAFVLPAFAVAFMALAGVLGASLWQLRAREGQLKALRSGRSEPRA